MLQAALQAEQAMAQEVREARALEGRLATLQHLMAFRLRQDAARCSWERATSLAARGAPLGPSDLVDHDCISWTGLGPHKSWEFTVRENGKSAVRHVPVNVRMSTTTPESAVRAALDGIGLVQATTYQVAPHVARGTLSPVLDAFESEPVPVNLVYPSKRLIPLKLRAWLDFAVPRLEQRLIEVESLMAGD